jgi:hypothetical protein
VVITHEGDPQQSGRRPREWCNACWIFHAGQVGQRDDRTDTVSGHLWSMPALEVNWVQPELDTSRPAC